MRFVRSVVHWCVRLCLPRRAKPGRAEPSRTERAVQISRTKSCVTNWATPTQIMEVLFDEWRNSFISFFQRSVRWTVPPRHEWRVPPSRIKRNYAHSFQLIVNSYMLTTLVHVCGSGPVWLYNQWQQFAIATELYRDVACRLVDHMILTSTYTHNDFFCDK